MLPSTLKLWIDGQVLVQAYSLRVEPLNLTTSYFNLLLFTQKMKVNLVTTSFNNVSNTVCYCPFFRAITTMLVIQFVLVSTCYHTISTSLQRNIVNMVLIMKGGAHFILLELLCVFTTLFSPQST